MHIAEIWRYPVKSMAGEPLTSALLTEEGIVGDRIVQVHTANQRVITARRHPALLGLRAALSEAGEVLVDGRPWNSPEVLAHVRRIAGPRAQLRYDGDAEVRFDVLPLLVATDGAIGAFGYDGRRLRPNLVIGGVEGLDERGWPGCELHVGSAIIRVDSLRGRCVMTTVDPDTLAQDHDVLRDIVRQFGGELALNCDVVRGGTIAVGQKVTLVRAAEQHLSHAGALGV